MYRGTGNPPPDFDPVRNPHKLKSICIFVDSPTPDLGVPHTIRNPVARGDVAIFKSATGFYGESTSNGRNSSFAWYFVQSSGVNEHPTQKGPDRVRYTSRIPDMRNSHP